ncbi:MAG: hypothetical protein C0621_08125 [Desulfuromonas sp.]|nr:MAG: hypothetical protein C0621_08125 [Desulfuromonas sp.]
MQENIFNQASEGIVNLLTSLINSYSGFLQISVYCVMTLTFGFALFKAYQTLVILSSCDLKRIAALTRGQQIYTNLKTPLAAVAGWFFFKTKKHYLQEKDNELGIIPPDDFIRDAAFQYSERYFEEKFLDPIGMMANLMPPLGFIGTIIGMVVHFLSNSGTLNSNITVAGIATALYTTFLGLICYTFLEFLRKIFTALAHKRIDEGLAVVVEGMKSKSEA